MQVLRSQRIRQPRDQAEIVHVCGASTAALAQGAGNFVHCTPVAYFTLQHSVLLTDPVQLWRPGIESQRLGSLFIGKEPLDLPCHSEFHSAGWFDCYAA